MSEQMVIALLDRAEGNAETAQKEMQKLEHHVLKLGYFLLSSL